MGFSPPAGGSGGGIAAGWAVSRTSGGMVTGASVMLGHGRMGRKKTTTKNKRVWLLAAWNIRQQSDDRKAFKYYAQYPVMQGFYGGKTCWFMGPMHPVSEYKHTNEHRARIPMFERIRLQFQWLYK